MPSAKRISFLPVIVASAAAAGGILGAFVAVGLVATPHKSAAPPAPVAQETKAAPSIAQPVKAAETTGSAPAANNNSAACDGQTWPYLSRPCMEEWRRKNRNVRVISTDKLDEPTVKAIEKPAPTTDAKTEISTAAGSMPASSEAMPVATSEPWFNPAALATPIAPPPAQQPASTAADKATETKQAATKEMNKDKEASKATKETASKDTAKDTNTASKEAATDTKDAAKTAAKEDVKEKSKHVATKSKRKAKSRQFEDDDDANAVASSDDDDRAPRDRADRSWRSRRHVVSERDDVPSDDGNGRRVVVIRRGGGLFENLFGMNRGRDYSNDDD